MNARLRNWLRRLGVALALILLIGSSGCGADLKAFGLTKMPVYKEPDAQMLTDAEKLRLLEWQASDPALFNKIQGSLLYYREIVRKHNEWARKINRKQLEALGYSERELDEMLGRGE